MKTLPTFAIFVIVSLLAMMSTSFVVGHVNAALPRGCTGNPHDADSGPTGNPHDTGETGNPHDALSHHGTEADRCPGS
jgi:hypothetical protein